MTFLNFGNFERKEIGELKVKISKGGGKYDAWRGKLSINSVLSHVSLSMSALFELRGIGRVVHYTAT